MVQQLKISKSCNNIYWQPLQQTPQHKKKKKPSKLVREIKMSFELLTGFEETIIHLDKI